MYCKISSKTWLVIFGTLVAILLRCCTTIHPYSGEGNSPMYGDYEAQRHWMEITTNLPISDWYKNTTDNDLMYWGLDYPPLTAYHMYVCGKIAGLLNENYTKLHDSRGYESEDHKTFMRFTVLICDVFLYIPAVIFYYFTCIELNTSNIVEKKNKKVRLVHDLKILDLSLSVVLALLYPGIILIDHGHFQYNCVSLGLFVFATTFLLHRKNILASILFVLAINYKQMELYHALPFFLYLLSTCVPKPGQHALSGIIRLFKIGITVILTFLIVWSPFLLSIEGFFNVLHRQFPIGRGVFEDKVSNVWCALNIFYKFKNKFDNYQMMRICLFTTLSAIFPSSVDLFLRPNLKKFVLALINSSLAFFLFSFQVHEKSILLVAIPIILYLPYDPYICFWFLCISIFSMIPLLVKDNLVIALIALSFFYVYSFTISIEHAYNSRLNTNQGLFEYYKCIAHALFGVEYRKGIQLDHLIRQVGMRMVKNKEAVFTLMFHFLMLSSLSGCVILFVCSLLYDPPIRYPDLYPLLISVYSCLHFLVFFVYFNVKQIRIPQEFEDIRSVKVKAL